jgi:catechol 2,3-dioxygenase-like lactoylglutathione lyase family enzyme
MIKHVKFVTIPVGDQQRALEFWTMKVGLEVLTDQPMGADRWIELLVPGAQTRVVLFRSPPERVGLPPPAFAATFAADSVEKTFRELSGRGVEFTTEPTKEPWGTFAVFRDPDGNHFLLGTP